ncbi:alkaline phosphatase family protein [Yeosuana aromativorans]|uniref:Alkaline phosphatase family protein n=1 Tax=Yeosuana aromativorans TaxID=288019 RepID=A0A8J3BV86_9FLAO|nr:ectonucleotide pyrophosphatase/phosphodiesterase [Yeosuana aromativorans]GGK33721.1 alkaline phosphatase family protein [Yeosuana aromativorans]
MKNILFLSILFTTFYITAQEPTYDAVRKNEIVSNKLENSKETLNKPYVIMVSLDGFRFDYAKRYNAKNILNMAKNGSSATRLIPSFPSKTFPNHYSIATGLYPEHHGIISNSFYNKETGTRYSIGNREAVQNGDWYGGIPLWNLAQLQGMCSASYYWVGSEADVNGMHPKYYYPYNKQTPYEYRIKRVLEWLQLPENVRPHIITLYFSLIDTNGHKYGPNSEETKQAVQYVDKQIGVLRNGLKKLNLPVYLVVTSDHGMDEVSHLINIHDYVNVNNQQFFAGPVAMIYTKDEAETDSLFNKLTQQTNFKTYKRAHVPNYLNYNDNPKIGDLVLITDPPNTIINSQSDKTELKQLEGTHGYDPFENKNMGAIFYIEGPDIKKDYKLSPIENVNIYPLIAHLLQLTINEPIDGKFDAMSSVIKE